MEEGGSGHGTRVGDVEEDSEKVFEEFDPEEDWQHEEGGDPKGLLGLPHRGPGPVPWEFVRAPLS